MKEQSFFYNHYYLNRLLTFKEFNRIKSITLKNRQLKNQGFEYAGTYSASFTFDTNPKN